MDIGRRLPDARDGMASLASPPSTAQAPSSLSFPLLSGSFPFFLSSSMFPRSSAFAQKKRKSPLPFPFSIGRSFPPFPAKYGWFCLFLQPNPSLSSSVPLFPFNLGGRNQCSIQEVEVERKTCTDGGTSKRRRRRRKGDHVNVCTVLPPTSQIQKAKYEGIKKGERKW